MASVRASKTVVDDTGPLAGTGSRGRQGAYAQFAPGDDQEVARQVRLDHSPYRLEPGKALRGGQVLQPQEDHAMTVPPVAVDQFAEILIFGEHDVALGFRLGQQVRVGGLGARFRRVEDIMPLVAE